MSAARHDRASCGCWSTTASALVAEHTPGRATGWAGSCTSRTQPETGDQTSRRPGPSHRHSTAWLAQAAQEVSRSQLSVRPGSARLAPDRPARPTRPRALPSCHSVGPEPARVAWWWDADHRQAKRIADSAGVARSPSAPAAPIASACRGWQPAAACRPAPYRDHPAAPARPRQTYDQRRRAQDHATGDAVPALQAPHRPSRLPAPQEQAQQPSTTTATAWQRSTYEGGPLMYDMVLARTLAPTDRPRA